MCLPVCTLGESTGMNLGVMGKLFVNDGSFTTVDQGCQQVKLYVLGGFHCGAWLSLVERYVRDVEVAGSNPVAPTFYKPSRIMN